jgi:hypothetical protein
MTNAIRPATCAGEPAGKPTLFRAATLISDEAVSR